MAQGLRYPDDSREEVSGGVIARDGAVFGLSVADVAVVPVQRVALASL